MIAFLLIIYTSIILVLFKLKIVKPRPLPIVCIITLGVLLLGAIVAGWMMCAPISTKIVSTEYVIQLVPYVKGQVRKIHAIPNQPLKKGDLLLEIDPTPYQNTLNQVTGSLEVARQTVNQAKSGLDVANANVAKAKDGVSQANAALVQSQAGVANAQAALKKAQAADELAKTEESIAVNLQKTDAGAISALKVTQAQQNRQAADAGVSQARAGVRQADAAEQQAEAGLAGAKSALVQAEASAQQAAFTVKVAESNLPVVKAQLDEAKFNLDQCKMYAPTDGFVVNWQVQDGTMLVSMPMAAAGTFINTADMSIAAVYPQNYLMNVKPGDDVEIVLDPYPGRLFHGKVDVVIPVTGEGQFTASGNIPYAAKVGSYGMLAVKIQIDPKERPASMPMGAGGSVAIYTEYGKPVHIISKVTIRMQKWLLYVLPSASKPS